MSFSLTVKDEIVSHKLRGEEVGEFELAALTGTAGSILISRGERYIEYTTESYTVGRHIARLAHSLHDIESSVAVMEREGRKSRSTVVRITGKGCEGMLYASGMLSSTVNGISMGSGMDWKLLDTPGKKRAFLRGAFLGSGSISDPSRSYHMEIVCRTERLAQGIMDLLSEFGLNANRFERKASQVVYIKDGDMICGFLALLGASEAALRIEDARMLKNARNDAIRITNYETANMQKTAKAAAAQIINIELIAARIGIKALPQPLFEVAEARLNNPEATLSQLAQMLGLGKSCVNSRLKKISDIAQDIETGTADL